MKALTLTEPWALLCVLGPPTPKEFETRSWATTYRGPLAIHAGKGLAKMTAASYTYMCQSEPFRSALIGGGYTNLAGLPRGAVVGTVELVAIYRIHADHLEDVITHAVQPLPGLAEQAFGDYTPGRFAWQFTNARALSIPIVTKGALSLWEWEPPISLKERLVNGTN